MELESQERIRESGGEDWPIEALGTDNQECSCTLFEISAGVLRTRRAFISIMMTTDRKIAKSDCLFYAVKAAQKGHSQNIRSPVNWGLTETEALWSCAHQRHLHSGFHFISIRKSFSQPGDVRYFAPSAVEHSPKCWRTCRSSIR